MTTRDEQNAARVNAELAKALEQGTLVGPAALALYLAVDRGYVYEHAEELGALRLGSGPRARLRFDLAEVRSRRSTCQAGRELNEREPAPPKALRRRRRRGSGTETPLLPIRGAQ